MRIFYKTGDVNLNRCSFSLVLFAILSRPGNKVPILFLQYLKARQVQQDLWKAKNG